MDGGILVVSAPDGPMPQTTVTGVEMFKKTLDSGQVRDASFYSLVPFYLTLFLNIREYNITEPCQVE